MRFFAIFLSLECKFSLKLNTYDDSFSMMQCLTSSRSKNHEKKNCGNTFGPNGTKSSPKLGFLPFPQVWFFRFPLNWIG